jgi:hypothetical protein
MRRRWLIIPVAPNSHDVGEIDQFERLVAHSRQPFQESGIFLHRTSRHPCDLSISRGSRLDPKQSCFVSDLFPTAIAQFLLDPSRPQLGIRWVDGAEAETVHKADNAIATAALLERRAQVGCGGRIEKNMKHGGRHGVQFNPAGASTKSGWLTARSCARRTELGPALPRHHLHQLADRVDVAHRDHAQILRQLEFRAAHSIRIVDVDRALAGADVLAAGSNDII